jgi:hypothetical protein
LERQKEKEKAFTNNCNHTAPLFEPTPCENTILNIYWREYESVNARWNNTKKI